MVGADILYGESLVGPYALLVDTVSMLLGGGDGRGDGGDGGRSGDGNSLRGDGEGGHRSGGEAGAARTARGTPPSSVLIACQDRGSSKGEFLALAAAAEAEGRFRTRAVAVPTPSSRIEDRTMEEVHALSAKIEDGSLYMLEMTAAPASSRRLALPAGDADATNHARRRRAQGGDGTGEADRTAARCSRRGDEFPSCPLLCLTLNAAFMPLQQGDVKLGAAERQLVMV